MSRARQGLMQIRLTLHDAVGLSSRVDVNKESTQYIFMMRVISSVIKLERTK